MFCPFFVQTGLCEAFAKFIYNSDSEEIPTESGTALSTVKIDPTKTHSGISLTENRLGSKITYHLRGKGKAICDTQVIQDKIYYEVRVIRVGDIRIGLAKSDSTNLEIGVGEDSDSWGHQFGATDELYRLKVKPGAIIGCLFDQSDYPAVVKYTRDGEILDSVQVTGMKGALYPAVSLAQGGEVEVIFDNQMFVHPIPEGFSHIMVSKNFNF